MEAPGCQSNCSCKHSSKPPVRWTGSISQWVYLEDAKLQLLLLLLLLFGKLFLQRLHLVPQPSSISLCCSQLGVLLPELLLLLRQLQPQMQTQGRLLAARGVTAGT